MLSRFKAAVDSVIDDMGGNKQLKQLHTAIMKGNEETAVQLYTSDSGSVPSSSTPACKTPKPSSWSSSSPPSSSQSGRGKKGSLSQTLQVNEPFKLRGLNEETPMNLVSQYCMIKLCKIFLENGGNPNSLNSQHRSCVHSLCSRPEAPEEREKLLKIFLDWESGGMSGEQASLNQVDLEGNTAVHLAGLNGLLPCVMQLVKAGAIISLVNNSQRTCCELADAGGHWDLASMLELALIFQPIDADMAAFDEVNSRANQSRLPTYMLDCESKTEREMRVYMDSLVANTAALIKESPARAETLLKLTNWNKEEVINVCQGLQGKHGMFVKANLFCGPVAQTIPDRGALVPVVDMEEKEREMVVSKISANELAIGEAEEAEVYLKEAATTMSGVPGAGTAEKASQSQCEICMVDLGENVGSFGSFMSKLRIRAATGVHSSPPSCVVALTEEEQDQALSCESGEHSYCLSCWSQNAVAKVTDHGFAHLACPGFKCGESAPLCWAPVLLQPPKNTQAGVMEIDVNPSGDTNTAAGGDRQALLASFQQSRTRRFVDLFHASHYCPHTGCDKVVLVNLQQSGRSDLNFGADAIPQTVMCSAGHASCLVCKEEAHAPCSCEEHRKWKAAVSKQMTILGVGDGKGSAGGAEEVATKLWFNANTKKCPRCGATIEKDEGCNHMTCGNCKHDFCWICMRPWSEHTNATGGYFVCNRFDSGSAATATDGRALGALVGNDDDVLGLSTRARGQAGSSSEEAKRQAVANQKMARFIHFFTRYNAHHDSMGKEISIRNATFSRILGNAERTADGELAWLRAERPDESIAPTPERALVGAPSHSEAAAAAAASPLAPPPAPLLSEELTVPSSIEDGEALRYDDEEGDSTNPLLSPSASVPTSASTATSAAPDEHLPTASTSTSATAGAVTTGGVRRSASGTHTTPQRARAGSSSIFSRSRARSDSGSSSSNGDNRTPLRNASSSFFRALFKGGGGAGDGGGGSKNSKGGKGTQGGGEGAEEEEQRREQEGHQQKYSSNTSSLLFLREAFEELTRARLFLKGSYAYGYFKFQEASISPRANKASLYIRHQVLAMEKCFTDAQGELEFSVELLSDVVARRRLRASQHDIRRSTLAARSKRLEMEDLLLGMEVAEATEKAVLAASMREREEERSVMMAKRTSSAAARRSASFAAGGKGQVKGAARGVLRASRGGERSGSIADRRRASAAALSLHESSPQALETPISLLGDDDGFGEGASDSVLRELISDLRAQQQAAGMTAAGGLSDDIDDFEALLQTYDAQNLPMAPTSEEAAAGDINSFQRAHQPFTSSSSSSAAGMKATGARKKIKKNKYKGTRHQQQYTQHHNQPQHSTGSSGSSGSFKTAAAGGTRGTPGTNVPSGSAHSSPVRLGRLRDSELSDASSEVSGSADSSDGVDDDENYDEDDGDSDADTDDRLRLQQDELRRRHLARIGIGIGIGTATATATATNSSAGVPASASGEYGDSSGATEEEEADDYELHRAILLSLNLGPGANTGGAAPVFQAMPGHEGIVLDNATAAAAGAVSPGQGQGQEQGPPEDLAVRVTSLTEMMGCSEEAAHQALTACNYSVEAALDRLLSG